LILANIWFLAWKIGGLGKKFCKNGENWQKRLAKSAGWCILNSVKERSFLLYSFGS
jgi:hypothetical protein